MTSTDCLYLPTIIYCIAKRRQLEVIAKGSLSVLSRGIYRFILFLLPLLIFYNLRSESGFHNHLLAYESKTVHRGDTVSDWRKQLYLED